MARFKQPLQDLSRLTDRGATLPAVGTLMHGGAYVGVITIDDATYGLIAPQTAAASGNVQFRTSTTAISGLRLSDGYYNTYTIMNTTEYPASGYARSYAGEGFSDWYLPTLAEMAVCFDAYLQGLLPASHVMPSGPYWAGQQGTTSAVRITATRDEVISTATQNFTSAAVLPMRRVLLDELS